MCSILFVSIVSPELGIHSQDSTDAERAAMKEWKGGKQEEGTSWRLCTWLWSIARCKLNSEEGSHTLFIPANILASV